MKKDLIIQGLYHKYEEVTFLRGFSILTIVAMHLIQGYMAFLPEWIIKASSIGGTGVHVFFLCSGFGLYLSYRHKAIGYIDFIWKRFIKVYIPYVLIIIISFIVPTLEVKGNRWIALFSHVFLFKMFLPLYDESFGPFWFVSTLFQFYLIFIPLCKFKKRIGNARFLCTSFMISLTWWIITVTNGVNEIRVYGSFFLQYLWEFAMGMILADVLYEKEEIRIRNIFLIAIAITGIVLEGLLGLKGGKMKAFNDFPALFGFGALGLLLWQVKIFQAAGKWLGKISYEWYLVHTLVFSLTFCLLNGIVGAFIAFILSVITAYFYHIFIKKCVILNFS